MNLWSKILKVPPPWFEGPLVACERNAVIINLMSDTPKALTDYL